MISKYCIHCDYLYILPLISNYILLNDLSVGTIKTTEEALKMSIMNLLFNNRLQNYYNPLMGDLKTQSISGLTPGDFLKEHILLLNQLNQL